MQLLTDSRVSKGSIVLYVANRCTIIIISCQRKQIQHTSNIKDILW